MIQYDPGSFKDPAGRVFEHEGGVYRILDRSTLGRMKEWIGDGFLDDLFDDGLVITSRLVSAASLNLEESEVGATVMAHERVPIVTYPYEWSFEMLRSAALTTLRLMERCLERDAILKDATPLNLAYAKGRMRWIDLPSIERYRHGQLWDGYAQFCREMLFPLMLSSYRGVPIQPLLRANLNGIEPRDTARLLRTRDRLRPGVLKHVVLQARLEASFKGRDLSIPRNDGPGRFDKELIKANVRGLSKIIRHLPVPATESVWISYADDNTYEDTDERTKCAFINRYLAQACPRRLVDIGSNTGTYALIAANSVETVIAADSDASCIDQLFRRLDGEKENIVPMVLDFANPSPRQGWALEERRNIFERLETDSFLALALIHHLCISKNIPIGGFVDMLSQLGSTGVVEWVDKSDAMVQRLLRNRDDVFHEYTWENLSAALTEKFEILETQDTHMGRRRLCRVARRS